MKTRSTSSVSFLAAAATCFLACSAVADWVAWPTSQGGNGHSYLAVSVPSAISWNEAFTNAVNAGGYLATITSAEENAFVYALINHPEYWAGEFGPPLGAYQPPGATEPGGGWVLVTGEAWGYSNWASGQPDNGAGGPTEDMIHFWGGSKWNDQPRTKVMFRGYVVEKDASACPPRKATALAQVVNHFVVDATITDGGCGYTNPPTVLIQGGGGAGATATATVSNGVVVKINIVNPGSGYTSTPVITIGSPPFMPTLSIGVSKVKVTQNVVLGRTYLLESSTDLITWTPCGPPFVAQSETVVNEFDVDVTGRFFRITEVQ